MNIDIDILMCRQLSLFVFDLDKVFQILDNINSLCVRLNP